MNFVFLLNLKAALGLVKMEFYSCCSSSELAVTDTPLDFELELQALDADEMDSGASTICAPYGDVFVTSDGGYATPASSDSDREVFLESADELEPFMITVSAPASPTHPTPPPTPVTDAEMEIGQPDVEIEEEPLRRAPSKPVHHQKPKPIWTRHYRTETMTDADGLNMFDRLLAKMPKSKAGRKRKNLTKNMTKNALAARSNRDKKKNYVQELEEGIRDLNGLFKQVLDELEETKLLNSSLSASVKYYSDVVRSKQFPAGVRRRPKNVKRS